MRYVCPDCRSLVKDKFIFGLLHFCLTDEERAARNRSIQQSQPPPSQWNPWEFMTKPMPPESSTKPTHNTGEGE